MILAEGEEFVDFADSQGLVLALMHKLWDWDRAAERYCDIFRELVGPRQCVAV